MVSVWPTDINRGGCLRAKEPGPGGLAAQGVLDASATLLSCHSTPATQEGSAPRHPDPHGAPRIWGLPAYTLPNF